MGLDITAIVLAIMATIGYFAYEPICDVDDPRYSQGFKINIEECNL